VSNKPTIINQKLKTPKNSFWLIIFGLLDTRQWIKSKNTLQQMLIHHRQKPTEVS